MSKVLQPSIYVKESVSSIEEAQRLADEAQEEENDSKRELWGMVMATPKDIVQGGEDIQEVLWQKFSDIWETAVESIIDNYKYTVIADDALYYEDSLVKREWQIEKAEADKMASEELKRRDFFAKYSLSLYNNDDITIYEWWRNGKIDNADELLTKEGRSKIINQINSKEQKILKGIINEKQ